MKLPKKEYKAFQDFVMDIGECQVCGGFDIATTHHAKFGCNKNDKTLVCICSNCHINAHFKGIDYHIKTRKEIEQIGHNNWKRYCDYKDLKYMLKTGVISI